MQCRERHRLFGAVVVVIIISQSSKCKRQRREQAAINAYTQPKMKCKKALKPICGARVCVMYPSFVGSIAYLYLCRFLDCECVDVSHFMCVCVCHQIWIELRKSSLDVDGYIYVIRWKISYPSQRCTAPLIGSPRRSSSSLSSLSLSLSHYMRPLLRVCVIIPPHLAKCDTE